MISRILASLMVFSTFGATAQINVDARKVARKGISKIVLDSGKCSISFDSLGHVTEMVIQSAAYRKQFYLFNPSGDWISFKRIELIKRGGEDIEFIEEQFINSFDDTGDLIYQVACYYDPLIETGDLPNHVDTFIYQKVTSENTLRISQLEYSSNAIYSENENLVERVNYFEETELIQNLNDSTIQIDYFKINRNDTIEKRRLLCYSNHINEIERIDVYDFESGKIESSNFDCSQIAASEFKCSFVHQAGEVMNSFINTRLIEYSKSDLYQDLPRSLASRIYLYCIEPLRALKASKKKFGKDSVKILL